MGRMSGVVEVLLVTGMSGAGKSTVLKTLEDLGWETVDSVPLSLLDRLVAGAAQEGEEPGRPLALGIGAGTRDFDPAAVIRRVDRLRAREGVEIGTLFLDCSDDELARRYSETRRRHPLALDRPAAEGIEQERRLLVPLRDWSNRLIDTTRLAANQLAQQIRRTFAHEGEGETTLTLQSFGFSRGVPPGVDMVFDMRFLRNPHWDKALRPRTGLDPEVAAYIAADPAYEEAVSRVEELLLLLLPRYHAEGKPYVTVAIGCTGGKHRSVHVTERIGGRLRNAGFTPSVLHRDLAAAPQDGLEGRPRGQ
jgi:UPF0042 nucleotide-binding protein